MKKYLIVFYNRFACQTQSYKVMADSEENAEKEFYKKHPKEQYYDCIESIEED